MFMISVLRSALKNEAFHSEAAPVDIVGAGSAMAAVCDFVHILQAICRADLHC